MGRRKARNTNFCSLDRSLLLCFITSSKDLLCVSPSPCEDLELQPGVHYLHEDEVDIMGTLCRNSRLLLEKWQTLQKIKHCTMAFKLMKSWECRRGDVLRCQEETVLLNLSLSCPPGCQSNAWDSPNNTHCLPGSGVGVRKGQQADKWGKDGRSGSTRCHFSPAITSSLFALRKPMKAAGQRQQNFPEEQPNPSSKTYISGRHC
ncbi:hypothetical protein JRQ81_019409 [Phrynocephalus forsythii]|uniref:Uncharacterized protein n=1 Tax=Phrynocephalus forsythii TaxID=171643 RepID=A0A9Q1AYA1_9SAUR|nr:hypothetical protein JRQ81_019409 [Phrynocephalus forsythii]